MIGYLTDGSRAASRSITPGWVLLAVLTERRTATGELYYEGQFGAARALLRRRGRVNGVPVWQLMVRPGTDPAPASDRAAKPDPAECKRGRPG
jgi:hypothetical protein